MTGLKITDGVCQNKLTKEKMFTTIAAWEETREIVLQFWFRPYPSEAFSLTSSQRVRPELFQFYSRLSTVPDQRAEDISACACTALTDLGGNGVNGGRAILTISTCGTGRRLRHGDAGEAALTLSGRVGFWPN